MKLAHIRERNAAAGARWRLAAALDRSLWLDLERARRTLAVRDPRLAHNDAVFRVAVTTLDAHLAAGRRVDALRAIVEPFLERPDLAGDPDDSNLLLRERDVRFGPPVLQPTSLRDFYAFEAHVRTAWA